MARKDQDPVRITSASRSHSADIRHRQRRYVISMSIRTVCFVLTVVSIGHWFMWLFLVGALILPYIAVVMANVGAAPETGGPTSPDLSRPAIEGTGENHGEEPPEGSQD
jgi:hypothetical protein